MSRTLVKIKKIRHAKNQPKFGLNSANYQKIGLADWHTLKIGQESAEIRPILFIADWHTYSRLGYVKNWLKFDPSYL